MFKPGRGGGGAAGRRPPAMTGPPRPGGRATMSHGRGRGGPLATSSSAQQQGRDESFSLESGGAPDFASIIRLVPGLVEEIGRYEAEGGTARIKFGLNPMNPTDNVIEVGAKEYKFNWSAELGVCDIYEAVQNGENNNGLLLERGSALRKMNVQRILDESAKNQVKMRSVQAELQSKSRKSIILDPANPSVQKQVKSMAAAGVEGSMRRWGQKDKFFKKGNQAPMAAPPKTITIAKTTAPVSPPQHLVETIKEEIIPRKIINSENRNFEKRQTPVRSNNGFEQRKNGNSNENLAELKTHLINILSDNPKGLSLKALEKAVGDAFPDSSKKIESIVKTIANFQAPGRYSLRSGFARESSKFQASDNKSSSDNEDHDPILQAINEMEDNNSPENYNNTPNNNTQNGNNNNNLNINLEEDPLDSDQIDIDIEGGSPVLNKIDINRNDEIDIEGGSPVLSKIGINKNEEREASSSDESDSDSDSDSSDNSESSPSHAGSRSQSSSQSDSENSSASDDADVEVNITSDDDERERNKIIATDLNVSPALKIVQYPLDEPPAKATSPLINLNEELNNRVSEENFDPIFGKEPVRDDAFVDKRASTSRNQKRGSTEKLPEASKRPKVTQDSPYVNQRPSGSFQKSPASTSKDCDTGKKLVPRLSGNNNKRVASTEGFCSDKPLRKHNRDPISSDLNDINTTPLAKRLRESGMEEKRGANSEKSEIVPKKVLRRELSELEMGEFREPSTPDDEFKRLFGSSSSSKPEEDDEDEDNNINNTSGAHMSADQYGKNNNRKDNKSVVAERNNGKNREKSNNCSRPVKKLLSKEKAANGEIKGKNNNEGLIMQNGNANNNTNGVETKRGYSSNDADDFYLVYSKFDKDRPDLKGPINDFPQYKEYVSEYQEKYKMYLSLNKLLEEYRDKYLKVGDEMETAKQRNMREYHKIVDKLRDMYSQDKERHEFTKKVFLILHEELDNLKQRLSDFYGEYTKD